MILVWNIALTQGMHHADALSRYVNVVEGKLALSKEIIREEQAKDALCEKYKLEDNFWVDEENVLYYQEINEQPRIVIPKSLVPTVLGYYHGLPFTAHQGVSRTVEFIGSKYWWKREETLKNT
jgi:hypothetical protein